MAYNECFNLQPRVRAHGWPEVSVDDGSFARETWGDEIEIETVTL